MIYVKILFSEKRQPGDRLSQGDLLQAEGSQEEAEGLIEHLILVNI